MCMYRIKLNHMKKKKLQPLLKQRDAEKFELLIYFICMYTEGRMHSMLLQLNIKFVRKNIIERNKSLYKVNNSKPTG